MTALVHPMTDWTMQLVVGASVAGWLTWVRYAAHGWFKYWIPSFAAAAGVYFALSQSSAFVELVSSLDAPTSWDPHAQIVGVPAAAFAYAFGLSTVAGVVPDLRPGKEDPPEMRRARSSIKVQQLALVGLVVVVTVFRGFAA